MNPEWTRFIEETRHRFGAPDEDWRRDLLGERADDLVDTSIVGAQAVDEIVHALRAGKIDISRVPPEVVKAFHLQFPNVGDFGDFIREHPDEEQLRGIVAGIKGKLFEMAHADYLNDGHLPHGFIARLATTSNQPGYDIVIEGPDHHVAGVLQDKATHTLQLVHEALNRYPNIPVAVPHELAQHIGSIPNVIDSGVSEASIDAKVSHIDNVTAAAPGYHFPLLSELLIVAHEGWRYARGRSSWRELRDRVLHRSSRSLAANSAGQIAAVATGHPVAALASIPARIAISRMDVNAALARSETERCNRFQRIKEKTSDSEVRNPYSTNPG